MVRLILSLALFLPVLLRAQSALEIVEPANASIIRPGEALLINVRTVSTYASLWLLADAALGTIQMLNTPPYRFSVQIPKDIVAGRYRLWATGCRRPGDCDDFEPITIDVEPIWPQPAAGSQSVNDAPGVAVNTGGVPVTHRSAIPYPPEAIEKRIGGTIIVEVTPDWEGRVEGIQVLSGPEELRKNVIKALLMWQFPREAGRKPRQVEIRFDPVEASHAVALQPTPQTAPRELPSSGAAQAPTSGPAPQRIRVSAAAQAAKLISKVEPIYPALAKAAHIQGVVRFSAILGDDGRVVTILILTGHPLLVQAARDAASQWRYSPTFVNGSPVEVVTQIEVEFFLPN